MQVCSTESWNKSTYITLQTRMETLATQVKAKESEVPVVFTILSQVKVLKNVRWTNC